MDRLLLGTATVLAAVLGWHLGEPAAASWPAAPAAAERRGELPLPVPRTVRPASTREIFERLAGSKAREQERGEIAARLFAELKGLKGEDFRRALGELSDVDRDWGSTDPAVLLAGWWAERDLAGAREWALGVKGAEPLVRAVFETWGRQDAPGLLAWVETHAAELKAGGASQALSPAVAQAAARSDPQRGLRLLASLAGDVKSLAAATELYERWARLDPAGAATRAAREPGGARRAQAIETVVTEWGLREPAAARAWAEQGAEPLLADRALCRLGRTMGERQPERGADFLASLPQTDGERQSLGWLLAGWRRRDPGSAFRWASAVPQPPVQAWALRALLALTPPAELEGCLAYLAPEAQATVRALQKPAPPGVGAQP